MQGAAALAVVLGAAGLGLAAPLQAQSGFEFSLGVPATAPQPVLRTIDDERLFRQSQFGQRVAAEIEAASSALEAENIRLLEELTAREDELTALRAEMTVEAFRAAAAAFDLQAETARREQAEKRQRLVQFEESERRRFFGQIAPILQDQLAELGGQVLIDARAVIIAAPGTDMTDEAVAALDAAIGDGGQAPFPLTLP
ncbi:MAG: OmpH family outer membrane protein [Rhodobacteraceae bacterium]|nr:MAG: OmpH family outer membrane protein [Paracoccaceae bacterium]